MAGCGAGLVFVASSDRRNLVNQYLLDDSYGQVGFFIVSTCSGSPTLHLYLPLQEPFEQTLEDLLADPLVTQICLRPLLDSALELKLRTSLCSFSPPPSSLHQLVRTPISLTGFSALSLLGLPSSSSPVSPPVSRGDPGWLETFYPFQVGGSPLRRLAEEPNSLLGPPELVHLRQWGEVELALAQEKTKRKSREYLGKLLLAFFERRYAE